ncbi:signal peptidase I [Halobacillus salinarum]|uniref:Signal peptidase I n=1 Tax=Halobacillus salinarum TaxID=2932257 RepID=A0ABY4EKZ4_9BACI|nr:signal peptidase I [Halobacillus salinarum]UOQ44538.1 signal peptidase I [Halobacillus salinarum]
MSGKKILSVLSTLLNILLFAVLVSMIFLVISAKASGGEPNIFGYQIKTVLSGSMEPTFKTGSVIAVNPDIDNKTFQKGDIVTFMKDKDTLVTHRIIDVQKTGNNVIYHTKGDNNDGPDMDPLLAENVVGEYTGITIPYLGKMITFANSQLGAVFLLIVPGVLLILYSAFTIWKTLGQFVDNKEVKNQTTKQEAQ